MARLTKNFESQGLSTQRISRLLRPLRTKCIALAAMHPPVCYKNPASYGSKARSVEFNPLDNLPPPDSVRSYHVDHGSVATLRAAIYAVRDSFCDIVVKTKAPEAEGSVHAHRVPRLADLCSIIVGEHMQADEDFGAEVEEDSDQLGEVEYLYEIIPVQYRRSALLAHALDIILRCPHHCTLLSILLDVSLQHDLYHESFVLIHWLLHASVSPASGVGSGLRLCHSAHSNYLVDLAQKWKGAGRPTGAFVRILTETLVKAARPELWRCKALGKFVRELHNHDFHSFFGMVGELVSSIDDIQPDKPHRNESRGLHKCGPFRTEEISFADQLNRWLNYSSPFGLSHPQDSTPIVEFLERCRQSRVHQNADSLGATVVCWATHYLSEGALSADIHTAISRFGVNETSMGRLQDSRVILQTYASCLRAEHLLLLEASLWACILRFVEASLGHWGTEKEVGLYREQLIELVEDAEQRCFGLSELRPRSLDPCSKATEFEWRWEEIPGCWVQCHLPVAKKVKRHHQLEDDCRHNLCPHNDSSSFELSFKSLVSSALSNRTKLHGHLKRVPQPDPGRRARPPLLPPKPTWTTETPSDDALDLFAYAKSSPSSV
ncbi:hypothetical protein B0H17DRAFT_1081797 [Mycena rosella]|uniref:Uncharacterized protein n=1 Tax=Mycena rosella TaxID=1033263 RepID=A0AAD7D2D5_MYCRO|nr:hypothetical protein B0H17DRAFT_1081797 [Mycena rosella]